jgi:4a-hydroxytetrahydrobiopterin dehydratase
VNYSVKHWKIVNKTLYRKFTFEDFNTAFDFIKKVAILAEQQNHHPNWKNNYNVVEIELKTHESNQITNKDILLANSINNIDIAK